MTEPTPDPDEPGEGSRTRPAHEGRVRVNGARRGGAHRTGTLAPEVRDTATPTNGALPSGMNGTPPNGTNGALPNGTPTNGTLSNGTHPDTRNGSNGANGARTDTTDPTDTTAFAPDAYGDGAHNDNMDVDAASHGTAPGNVANGGGPFAGASARPPTGVNGVYATSGHAGNGHAADEQVANWQASNGQASTGHNGT